MLDFDRMAGAPGGRPPPPPRSAADGAAAGGTPWPLLTSIATVGLAGLLLIPLAARPQVVPERPGLLSFPMVLGDRVAQPRFLDTSTEEVLDADDYILLDFVADDAPAINLWVAYYETLLDGSYFHSPTTCLPGAGWEYVQFGARTTPVTDLAGEPLVVNRGVIVNGQQRILMYFWMELRGRSLRGLQYVKFFNLWDSLLTGRSDGALVRLYTPLEPGETAAAGDARLLALLERAYPHLAPHVGR
jgi:EpsI family protein